MMELKIVRKNQNKTSLTVCLAYNITEFNGNKNAVLPSLINCFIGFLYKYKEGFGVLNVNCGII